MAAHHPGAQRPQDIHALLQEAFNAGDIDAFVAVSEPGATHIVPPDGRRVQGHDALRAALEPIFALGPEARMEVVGALEGDGIALTHGRWWLDLTGPGGATEQLSGRGTIVSRRQADGTWRIVLDDPTAPV